MESMLMWAGASLDIGPEGMELLSLWRDKGSPSLPLYVH